MVSSRLLAVAGVILGAILLGRGRGQQSGQDSTSGVTVPVDGDQPSSEGNIVLDLVDQSPLPDAPTDANPPVSPPNAVTEGAVWQGPDPANLAPIGEGRGDLIAPVNPGNVVMGGPLYTGPDPLNLGGE
jgi:hypothetical protein